MLAFALVQLLRQCRTPLLLEAVNRNLMVVLLTGNILTGVINMQIDTLHTADWPARVLVAGYMFLLCAFPELWSLRKTA